MSQTTVCVNFEKNEIINNVNLNLRVLHCSSRCGDPMHPLSPGEPYKHSLKDLRVPPPHVNEQSPHSPKSLQVGQSVSKLQT